MTGVQTCALPILLQTVASSVYDVDTFRIPGRVTLGYGQSWPTPRDEFSAVRITHVCGYGTSGDDVDLNLRHACLLMISNMYENREPVIALPGINAISLPLSIEALMRPFVIWGFH